MPPESLPDSAPKCERAGFRRVNLRMIHHLSRLHYASTFVEGLAAVFRFDSVPNRALTAATKVLWGLDQAAGLAISRERKRWHSHARAGVIVDGITRYGRQVLTLNEDRHVTTEIWQIGEHVVLWDSDWKSGSFKSLSTLDEIAAEVLARSLREIGPGARALLSDDGIAADPVNVPDTKAERVVDLIATLRREMEHQHRAILLHGPSGSGKTVASRQIAEALADTVVVVSSSMTAGHPTDDPFALVCSWRPQAVVFDDLDRAVLDSEGWVLGGIDRVRAVVPLVIATANVRDDFSGALLRPGRFDRIEKIDRLDRAIAEAALTAVPDAVRAKAIDAGLLAAYCAELNLRCRCGDDAEAVLAEMLDRQRKAGDGATPVGDYRAR